MITQWRATFFHNLSRLYFLFNDTLQLGDTWRINNTNWCSWYDHLHWIHCYCFAWMFNPCGRMNYYTLLYIFQSKNRCQLKRKQISREYTIFVSSADYLLDNFALSTKSTGQIFRIRLLRVSCFARIDNRLCVCMCSRCRW